MNLKAQLLKEHSKQNANYIAEYIGNNTSLFDELFQLFVGNEYRMAQRSAYVLGIVTDNYPALIKPYVNVLIENLDNDVIEAVKRNTVRTLQSVRIPETQEGRLTEKCFEYLTSNKESIAVKVFSMSILGNMTMKYPDLKNELKLVIEDLMENGTPGIISRGGKVLKQLEKIHN